MYLDDASVAVTDRQIVVDDDALEMFDEAALQVTASTGLHSRVNQTLNRNKSEILRLTFGKFRI